MGTMPPSRPFRILLALLLLSFAWRYADAVAKEVRSEPASKSAVVRALAMRPAAGRVPADFPDGTGLPEPRISLPALGVERIVGTDAPARKSPPVLSRHLQEYPRGPPRDA